DAQGRMTSATVDLSPEDNSIADGRVYTTSYGYDGSSSRIAWISQSDGSFLSISYDGGGRVAAMTETIAAGVTRTTTLGYGAGYTTVTDATGQVVRLDYLANGALHKITAPPASAGAPPQTVWFAYTPAGDLSTTIDAAGNGSDFTYDSRGNRLTSTDRLGNVISWTYDSNDQILTETRRGSDASSADAQHTTRYVYDSESHLRYVVSAEGRVTEHRYRGSGELEYVIDYPEHHYDVGALGPSTAPSEAQMDAWRNALGDRSSTRITYNTYNARGQIASATNYSIATAWGDPSTAEGYERSVFSYDQSGLLRARWREGEFSESYVYDGSAG
ncbi:MAG TPA: hypothetical protein VEA60_12225, partial [Allosphingosinicella sp.]|nr:hypothetical protein [Allosphingosinicella sp.]